MAYHSCKNCNHPFGNSYKYCPNCGLKQGDELTLKELFNNTIQNYFAFDARFFKSFIPLLIKPGYLPKKFIEGQRLTFLHPAQLYLFSTILFFFLFSFQVNKNAQELNASLSDVFVKKTDTLERDEIKDDLNDVKQINTSGINSESNDLNVFTVFNEKKVDSLIAIKSPNEVIYKEMGLEEGAGFYKRQLFKQILKFYKNPEGGSIYKYFIQSIPIALFFVLPIFALLLRLFYYKLKSYSHHLVFSFYYFAFIFFTFSIIMLSNYIYDLPQELDVLIIVSCFIYLVMAIKNFYNKKWLRTFFKSILLVATYFLFVLPLGAAITLLLSFLFY